MERIKEQGERLKVLAEILLKKNKRVFIKDIDNNIYFADILFVGEDTITIQCFNPIQRRGQKFFLYWALIVLLEECREERR